MKLQSWRAYWCKGVCINTEDECMVMIGRGRKDFTGKCIVFEGSVVTIKGVLLDKGTWHQNGRCLSHGNWYNVDRMVEVTPI